MPAARWEEHDMRGPGGLGALGTGLLAVAVAAPLVLAGPATALSSTTGSAATSTITTAATWSPVPTAPVPGPVGVVVPRTLFGNHLKDDYASIVSTARIDAPWREVQPTADTWDFAALDARVAAARAKGMAVMLVLGGTPLWAGVPTTATGDVFEYGGLGSASPPASGAQYEAFVKALALRYGAKIDAYQVWNEGNIPNFFRGTPAQLADITLRTKRAVRAAGSKALIVAASTGTRWVKGYAAFYPTYLAELKKRAWPVDVFSAHLYPAATGGPDQRLALLGMVQKSLRLALAPKKPIWDTEINYGLAGSATVEITGARARTLVARTYLDSVRYGVARAYWFGWFVTGITGIRMVGGTDAAKAYATTKSWLVGATYRGCVRKAGGVTDCTFTRSKRTYHVVWTDKLTVAIARPLGTTTRTTLLGATARTSAKVRVGTEPVRLG